MLYNAFSVLNPVLKPCSVKLQIAYIAHFVARGENFCKALILQKKRLKPVEQTPNTIYDKVVKQLNDLFKENEARTKKHFKLMKEASMLSQVNPSVLGMAVLDSFPIKPFFIFPDQKFDDGHYGKPFHYKDDFFTRRGGLPAWAVYEDNMDAWASLTFVSDVLLRCGKSNELTPNVLQQLVKAVESAQKKHLTELSMAYLSALRGHHSFPA
jgi:hypothetical protein